MVERVTAHLTLLFTLLSCVCVAGPERARAADGSLQAARQALSRYEASVDEGSTLRMLSKLSELASGEEAGDVRQKAEARFLRAAVATDLLVLARVRDDALLQPALEAALEIPAGSVYTHLDAELSACAQLRDYAQPAVQLRAVLSLARDPQPARHLASYRGVAGSERDLLFLHAIGQLTVRDANLQKALSTYGEVPSADSEVGKAFDAVGAQAVATLLEAGNALKRLNKAAKNGDPLAVSAMVERSVFSITIPGIVLSPSPKLPEDVSWSREADVPDLLLFADAAGVSYGFVPHAQLDNEGNLELVGRGEPRLPNTTVFRYGGPAAAVHPIAALSKQLREVLSAEPECRIAVVVAPGVPAAAFGSVLASFKSAGGHDLVLVGHNSQGQAVAQAVAVESGWIPDPQPGAQPEFSVRVRLGGYLIKSAGGSDLEVPRVRDSDGYHLDTAALSARLGRRHYARSHVSFVPGVPGDQVTATLLQVASSSSALSLWLR